MRGVDYCCRKRKKRKCIQELEKRRGHNLVTHVSCLLTLHPRRLPLLPRSRTEFPLNRLHSPQIKPRANKDHQEIEAAKGPKDAIIQPSVFIEDVEPGRVLVAGGVLAELAEAVAAVLHVAACLSDEGGGVGLACLTWRGGEAGEFFGGADDGAAVGGDGEEAFEEIAEGR